MRDSGLLSHLFKFGLVNHVPFLMLDVFDTYRSLVGKTHKPVKETADNVGISSRHCRRILSQCNEIISF